MTDQPADYATATIRGVLTDLQRIAGEPEEPVQSSEIERLASVLDSLSGELAEAASALRSLTHDVHDGFAADYPGRLSGS
jgi:hypothetical protein